MTTNAISASAAGRSAVAILLFATVACLGLAADLLSKHIVFDSMLSDGELIARAEIERQKLQGADSIPPEQKTRYVLHQFRTDSVAGVRFTLSVNPGVVFGWRLPPWAVAIATVITIAMVCAFFATSERNAWSVHLALACILAGAMGNLYDRVFSYVSPLGMAPIRRNVRDFIDCADIYYPWVFNVADVLLVVGVALLAVHWFRASRTKPA